MMALALLEQQTQIILLILVYQPSLVSSLHLQHRMSYHSLFSAFGDLPSASAYHGAFAHVHARGKGILCTRSKLV